MLCVPLTLVRCMVGARLQRLNVAVVVVVAAAAAVVAVVVVAAAAVPAVFATPCISAPSALFPP